MKGKKTIAAIIMFLILILLSSRICYAQEKTSNFLCEYAKKLYEQGCVKDAIRQLKVALSINPYNFKAKELLSKIVEELEFYGQEISPEIESRSMIKRESGQAGKVEQLQSQLAKLQQESYDYQQQLTSLKDKYQDKDIELAKINQQLQSQIDKYTEELTQKDKDLLSSKSDYERQLSALSGEISIKQAKIEELKKEKESILAMNRRIASKQLARIDKLRREIEDILPELKEIAKYQQQEGIGYEDWLSTRIETTMHQIQEVLPDVEKLASQETLSEQELRTKGKQLVVLERLMNEIEEFLPELKEPQPAEPFLTEKEVKLDDAELDQIDRIMREIEEVLPKSE